MSRKTWHKIHKWISVVVGVFLFTWTVSGIIMMMPARLYAPQVVPQTSNPDYRSARLSPAQAIDVVEESIGMPAQVVALNQTNIMGRLVYEIWLASGESRLVDASSGDIIWINPEIAEQIARGSNDSPAALQKIELLEKNDWMYPFGSLPVYRVIFTGEGSLVYYVSAVNGSLSQSTLLTRLVAAIISLHTFEPVRLLTDQNAVRKGLIVLFAGIALCTILTGYTLAILPYLRKKPKSKNLESSI